MLSMVVGGAGEIAQLLVGVAKTVEAGGVPTVGGGQIKGAKGLAIYLDLSLVLAPQAELVVESRRCLGGGAREQIGGRFPGIAIP